MPTVVWRYSRRTVKHAVAHYTDRIGGGMARCGTRPITTWRGSYPAEAAIADTLQPCARCVRSIAAEEDES